MNNLSQYINNEKINFLPRNINKTMYLKIINYFLKCNGITK
jgi:hypothetical protein